MSRYLRLVACLALIAAGVRPGIAQTVPDGPIKAAAEAHALFLKKGGLNAVKKGVVECWENAERLATYEAAVYCSAYHFTAANFDAEFMRLLKARPTEGISEANKKALREAKPTVPMADANLRAKRALIASGVDADKVPALMDEIRCRVIAATNQQF